MTRFVRSFTALLLAAAVAAQDDPCPGCPHQGLQHVEPRIEVPLTISCGGEVRVNVGPIEWRNPSQQCPAVVSITPGFDLATRDPGSCARATARYTVEMRLFYFECSPIFIFPIFGTRCTSAGSDSIHAGTHYELEACPAADEVHRD